MALVLLQALSNVRGYPQERLFNFLYPTYGAHLPRSSTIP